MRAERSSKQIGGSTESRQSSKTNICVGRKERNADHMENNGNQNRVEQCLLQDAAGIVIQELTHRSTSSTERLTIMQSFHDASGHCGHTKTWSQLKKRFYGKVATKK
jgi:hypothetical protein